MKAKNLLITGLFFIVIIGSFTGCNSKDNAVEKRYVNDNSALMTKVPMQDAKYDTYVIQKVTPIANAGYTLNMQTQALKMDRGDAKGEAKRIDNMLRDVQTLRSSLTDITVNSTRQANKDSLVQALDNYSASLTSYKNILESGRYDGNKLQFAIDQVSNALDSVKQYTRN